MSRMTKKDVRSTLRKKIEITKEAGKGEKGWYGKREKKRPKHCNRKKEMAGGSRRGENYGTPTGEPREERQRGKKNAHTKVINRKESKTE